jgi:hypothetical protein
MRRERLRRGWTGGLALIAVSGLAGCGGGGGGGGGGRGNDINDPVISLVGPTGKYSQTPTEANQSNGAGPPPVMPNTTTTNQFFRLEVPWTVNRTDLVSPDPTYAAFSQLIGNLVISDETGAHVHGVLVVNGVDAFGVYRAAEPGFPHDLTAGGQDRNLGPGVVVYVADTGDNSFATVAAFGGSTSDSDNLATTTDIAQIRVSLNSLDNRNVSAFYTITIDDGTTGDVTGPKVISLQAESPDPTDPLNPAKCTTSTRFIIQFSEPMIPSSVGKSAALNGFPFLGNLPLLPTPPLPPLKPLPHTQLTTQLNATVSPLFLPFDVRPLNSNNLATFVITPLVDLPANRQVDVVEVDGNGNRDPLTGTPFSAMDLSGNLHVPGAEVRTTFDVGHGRVPVNCPVSPEVFYWLPIAGDGIGAVDLNGYGFTTNTPGKWDNTRISPVTGTLEFDPDKSALYWQHAALVAKGPVNSVDGLGLFGVNGNAYGWKVGSGSYRYGPPLSPGTAPFAIGAMAWQGAATDLGNPGTPVPGINEMSSGFETLVRNAEGDVILTGRSQGSLGPVSDMALGEFLDAGIFDTQSIWNATGFRTTLWWPPPGRPPIPAHNMISDPPQPNPPPLRYWVGLQPIDILVDQTDPLAKARLIEGEEVWAAGGKSYGFIVPNQTDPLGFDFEIAPTTGGAKIGPSPQSATAAKGFTCRQQVGNYLYAVDPLSSSLQVLNSNTFQVITTLDLPTPAGVAVMANNRYVFTANSGDDSMSVIGADPTKPDFHKEIARVDVGRGPKEIACDMAGEDVLVVNSLDDTVSIVSLATLSVRKTLDTLIDGPRQIVIAPRQNGFGWSAGVYFAYIANFTGNNVVVYESGPDGPQGIGCNNVLGALPTADTGFEIFEPRGLVYSPYTNDAGLYAGGVYVAHRDGSGAGLVTHIQFTHQALFGPLPCVLPPGTFFIPPGFNERLFEIVGQWGAPGLSGLIGAKPSSIVLDDFRYDAYSTTPTQPPSMDSRGTPGFGARNSRHPIQFIAPPDPLSPHTAVVTPDRMYVAFEDVDRIQILDPIRVGIALGEVKEPTGVGIKKLVGYYNSQ